MYEYSPQVQTKSDTGKTGWTSHRDGLYILSSHGTLQDDEV